MLIGDDRTPDAVSNALEEMRRMNSAQTRSEIQAAFDREMPKIHAMFVEMRAGIGELAAVMRTYFDRDARRGTVRTAVIAATVGAGFGALLARLLGG